MIIIKFIFIQGTRKGSAECRESVLLSNLGLDPPTLARGWIIYCFCNAQHEEVEPERPANIKPEGNYK